jgi:hypothetical protein
LFKAYPLFKINRLCVASLQQFMLSVGVLSMEYGIFSAKRREAARCKHFQYNAKFSREWYIKQQTHLLF